MSEIAYEKRGHCGIITLDRPRALNALTFEMVATMGGLLDELAQAPDIRSVVVRSSNQNAFCAGADIKRVCELGKQGQHEAQLAFLRAEYRNCHRIKSYPKPIVSLIDGVIMGGGAGIAINGAHRIVGDRITFAMPEVVIGFFPDVGATYFLPRLPHHIGVYLALTGARAALGDGLALGLATAHVPSAQFESLLERLVAGEAADRAIAAMAVAVPPGELWAERDVIARAFAPTSIMAIFKAIEAAADAGSAFAATTLKTLQSRSPTSIAIALRQMSIGAELDFAEALKTEFRIASRIVHGHDFYEGVRATLVDKDHAPQWKPATIDAVTIGDVDAYFAPLGKTELQFQDAVDA